MTQSLEKVVVVQGGDPRRRNGYSLLSLLSQRLSHDHGHAHVPTTIFTRIVHTKKKIVWLSSTTLIIFLLFSQQVSGNPFPKQGQAVNGNIQVSPSFYPPNRFVPLSQSGNMNSNNHTNANKSVLSLSSSEKDQEQVLVEPSKMTFELKHPFCKEDVSLARITCRNVRKREDLPEKQDSFQEVQQAIFVNISGSDIRLENIKQLFPNLIVLGITESPGFAASLINLQATHSQNQFGRWDSMVPKSLLQDPYFAKRIRLNQMNGLGPTLTSFASGNGGIRGQRALIADHSTSTTTTTTTESTSSLRPRGNELDDSYETNDIPLSDVPMTKGKHGQQGGNTDSEQRKIHDDSIQMDAAVGKKDTKPEKFRRIVWPSIRHLNISWNDLQSNQLPDFWGEMFPNLELLDLSNNFIVGLDKVEKAGWERLSELDVSGNPLDCIKLNLDWIEGGKIKLLHPNETMCDQPPHQNKPKPIFKVLPLIKNMRDKCKELKNCTCDIDYIYEKDHVVHAMTVVNCSGKGFLDFPNPAHLPLPTSTLDLTKNKIRSLSTFVDNQEYLKLNVTNLYLDDNHISSINILEGSEWFYDFQVFTIRRNNLTEVPVYILDNVFRQNERLLQLDLSENKYRCDCSTVSSFKVWLLKYSSQIGNVDKVLCASTKEQIRYMRMEVWCKMDNGAELIDVLDLVSIVLAILIVVVIAKVYYDYWNFKTKGKLPWIVSKM